MTDTQTMILLGLISKHREGSIALTRFEFSRSSLTVDFIDSGGNHFVRRYNSTGLVAELEFFHV